MTRIDGIAIKIDRAAVPTVLLALLRAGVAGRAQRLKLAREEIEIATVGYNMVRYRGRCDPALPRAVSAQRFNHEEFGAAGPPCPVVVEAAISAGFVSPVVAANHCDPGRPGKITDGADVVE